MAPAILQNIGPMSQEAFNKYEGLTQLFKACTDIEAAHDKLSHGQSKALCVDQHQTYDLVASTAQQASKLRSQQELLPAVLQHQLGSAARLPQVADL